MGALAFNLTGNELNNVLTGNGAVNRLTGLGGNDTYFVDSALDQVIEAAGQGNDNVIATKSHVLAAGVSVEALRTAWLASIYAINLTGNEMQQFPRQCGGEPSSR